MATKKLDFDKEVFKKEVVNNVKTLYRRQLMKQHSSRYFRQFPMQSRIQLLISGLLHRRNMRRKMLRLYIIYPWSS